MASDCRRLVDTALKEGWTMAREGTRHILFRHPLGGVILLARGTKLPAKQRVISTIHKLRTRKGPTCQSNRGSRQVIS
jgi:hypothetical protein